MDSFLTMERFLKMRGHLITPLFSILPLDHDFNFNKNQNDPLNTLSTEIEYVRRNLKQIGDETKISRLCRIVNYALYIHAVDLGDIIDEKTLISHNLYHNLISIYITHQNISQIDREKYLDLCKNNQGIMLASDTLRRFERILDKEGFDSKTFNLSAIFLVLFWANLERLKKVLRNKALGNFNEAEKSGVALFDIEVIRMVKDCTECHMLIHYIGKFFIQNGSAEMEYIESIGKNKMIKSTQAKGGKSKGETGKKIVEATIFFWKKCVEYKPELIIKTFSEGLYCAYKNPKNKEIASIEEIKRFIINLEEKEKLEILKKSPAKPDSIAKRLGEILKNLSSDC